MGDDATGAGKTGPATQGATATFVNGQPALRVGDSGDHQQGGNWQATQGSSSVFIEGKPAHRQGDGTVHDGDGQLTSGSPDVDVGTGNGSDTDKPHDLTLVIEVRDATDRKIKGLHVRTDCPHPDPGGDAKEKKAAPPAKTKGGKTDDDDDAELQAFDETITLTGLCSSTPITVFKTLERGEWDAGGVSGGALPTPNRVDSDDKSVRYIHAPAPESKIALELKTKAEMQTAIDKADPPKAVLRMTTAYNWMELVYQAFNQTMPTKANEVALLGVREGNVSGGSRLTRDDDFNTNKDFDEVISKSDPSAKSHATTYDDLVFMAVAPTDPAVMQRVECYEASIDPGNIDGSAPAIPLLLEGKLYQSVPSTHNANGKQVACIQLYVGSVGKMNVNRIRYLADSVEQPKKKGDKPKYTVNANHRTFEVVDDAQIDTSKSGYSSSDAYKFFDDHDNSTVLLHFGGEPGFTIVDGSRKEDGTYRGSWSTGCTVIHHGPTSKRYLDLATTENGAANKRTLPYLVVSTRYVKTYAEWRAEVDKHPDQVPKASSVLRTDGLETPTDVTGQYLPSTMTKAFADAVTAKVKELRKPETPQFVTGVPNATVANNLETSLTSSLFTIVAD